MADHSPGGTGSARKLAFLRGELGLNQDHVNVLSIWAYRHLGLDRITVFDCHTLGVHASEEAFAGYFVFELVNGEPFQSGLLSQVIRQVLLELFMTSKL